MSALSVQKFVRRTYQAACVGKANFILQLALMGQALTMAKPRSRLR